MLTELSVKNFKSWSSIDQMRLAPITGLFGTNSSGKSSILQLLLLLKQTAEASDRKQVLNFGGESDYVRMGSYHDVVHGQKEDESLGFEIKWELEKPLSISDPHAPPRKKSLFTGKSMSFGATIGQGQKGRLTVMEMAYGLENDRFALRHEESGEYILESDTPSNPGFRFIRNPGRAWPIKDSPSKCYGFPEQVNAYHQNTAFLSDLELELERLLGRIYYLAPLRDFPERHYGWSGAEPASVGRRGELYVAALLAGRSRGKSLTRGRGRGRKKETIEERVAIWLKELGLIESFAVQRIAKESNLYEVRVSRRSGGPRVLIPDVGFGVSQVLPVLVLCYYAPEGSTLMLEQPEIHLHPSVQSGLADVFIDVAKTRNVQIIVESHSEHLLTRLQRRIAEGEGKRRGWSEEKTALYFCETNGGASRLVSLDVDLYGNIRNWPEDFFGDRFEEIAARQEAGLKRQAAEEGK